jgi:CheY-like chemotaxis protein
MPNTRPKPLLLCVDDIGPALSLRKLMLQSNGFEVLTAHDAAEALMLFGCKAIEIVVADHLLGHEDGITLAGEFKRLRPGVPVVMLSGSEPESFTNLDAFIEKGEPIATVVAGLRGLLAQETLLLVGEHASEVSAFSGKLKAHLTLLTLEADSGISAAHLAKLYRPDYIFIDSRMADASSVFGVVSLVSPRSHISVLKSLALADAHGRELLQ